MWSLCVAITETTKTSIFVDWIKVERGGFNFGEMFSDADPRNYQQTIRDRSEPTRVTHRRAHGVSALAECPSCEFTDPGRRCPSCLRLKGNGVL